jgi:hypothetical protein
MIKAQQSWVKHRDTPKYKEGDLVWLEGKNLHINQPTVLRLVGRSVRRARDGVILKSTTNKGGLL